MSHVFIFQSNDFFSMEDRPAEEPDPGNIPTEETDLENSMGHETVSTI